VAGGRLNAKWQVLSPFPSMGWFPPDTLPFYIALILVYTRKDKEACLQANYLLPVVLGSFQKKNYRTKKIKSLP
jgi:hypothetical protein